MSTIKVNSIKNTSTNDGGIAIDNSGHVQIDGQQLPSTGPLSNRNLIINGAMQIAQRGTQETGISTTANSYRTVDRFSFQVQNLGTWTMDQGSGTPENGFASSAKMTCTTADASPTTNDYVLFYQFVEAQNLQHLLYGTSNAKSVTLSFWVKSNKTGTASCDIAKPDTTSEFFSKTYQINTANTWEYKTITFPGNTLNSIDNDNESGLQLFWWLNSGSDFQGGSVSTAWRTTSFPDSNRNVNNLGVGGAVNDYFEITGVQLEVGSVATPFEHRSYGDELAKCQRYYFRFSGMASGRPMLAIGFASSTTRIYAVVNFPVEMRDSGAVTESNLEVLRAGANVGVSLFSNTEGGNNSGRGLFIDADTGSPFTAGEAVVLRMESSTPGAFLAIDSEL
jgi:hypothetical protein